MASQMVTVVLCHVCNAEPYVGTPGEVVLVPRELAEEWLGNGGAKLPEGARLPKPAPADGEQGEGEQPKGKKRQGGRTPKPAPADGEQGEGEQPSNES